MTFDLDDTLYLERDYVYSGFRAVAECAATCLNIDDFFERAWSSFERGDRRTIFDTVLVQHGVPPNPALIDMLVATYRSHIPDIALLPDVIPCLDGLSHVKLAVVTDGPRESQRAKAEALGVRRWINTLVFTAELGDGYGKPHPRAFSLVERLTGCNGPSCMYLADNPAKDFAGPSSRGWMTVRIRRRGSLHEDIPSGSDVDLEIAELSELRSALHDSRVLSQFRPQLDPNGG